MRVYWNDYLPDHSYMNVISGAINKLLVSAPLFIMASISVKARSVSPDFTFLADTPAQDAVIDAYRPIVSQTHRLLSSAAHETPTETVKVRRLAQEWVQGYKSGTLKPLSPAGFEDSTSEGVKADIVRSVNITAEYLNFIAYHEAFRKQFDQSAKDAMQAMDSISGVKYSDLSSLTNCALTLRRSLNVLSLDIPHVSTPVLAVIRKRVSSFDAGEINLTALATRARDQFIQYKLRRGGDLAELSAFQKMITPFSSAQNVVAVANEMRSTFRSTWDESTSSFVGQLRLGYSAVIETEKRAALTKHLLSLSPSQVS